jgi:hypothetical protein
MDEEILPINIWYLLIENQETFFKTKERVDGNIIWFVVLGSEANVIKLFITVSYKFY